MGNRWCTQKTANPSRSRNGGRHSPSRGMQQGGMDIIRPPGVSPVSLLPENPGGLSQQKVVVALYSYTAREMTDMSFNKGDRLLILDDSDADWWKAEHISTRNVGYIPRNFVAPDQSVESYDWFFGHINRKEAENLLLNQNLPSGAFLVRYSEQTPGAFSLTVRDWDVERGAHVKHYKIRNFSQGGYFVTTRQIYATLPELISAFSRDANGLCHVLTVACPKPRPTMWDLSPQTRDQWEIDRSELQFIKKLGSGNFGEVWYGKWRNAFDVAIKTLKTGSMSPSAFLQEAAIMKKFRHPNLVALYAVCSKEEPFYIVTEYVTKGSLLELLRKDEGKTLNFGDLLYISSQVANGMSYLESKHLIHRDLAARNVLVGEGLEAKVCDFGLARVIKDQDYCPSSGTRFPVKWTAPEAALYGKFSIKSDVWSYGILLMEVFTYGQVPYPGMHNREVIENLEKGYRMPKPSVSNFPDSLYRMMLQCWDADPDKRPTFEFLHHFLENFGITSEIPYREVED